MLGGAADSGGESPVPGKNPELGRRQVEMGRGGEAAVLVCALLRVGGSSSASGLSPSRAEGRILRRAAAAPG